MKVKKKFKLLRGEGYFWKKSGLLENVRNVRDLNSLYELTSTIIVDEPRVPENSDTALFGILYRVFHDRESIFHHGVGYIRDIITTMRNELYDLYQLYGDFSDWSIDVESELCMMFSDKWKEKLTNEEF